MQVEKRPLALCTNVIFYVYGHYACAYCMFILQGQTVKSNRQIFTKFFSVVFWRLLFVLLSFIFRPFIVIHIQILIIPLQYSHFSYWQWQNKRHFARFKGFLSFTFVLLQFPFRIVCCVWVRNQKLVFMSIKKKYHGYLLFDIFKRKDVKITRYQDKMYDSQ